MIPQYIKKILEILVLLGIIFFTFPKVKELVQSITDPCSKTQTFSIESIDPKFGIATSTVFTYLREASGLWNKAYPNTLLLKQVPEGGDILISFVYDERQRTTIRNERLNRQVREQEEKISTLKNTIVQLQAEYNTQKGILISLENDYTIKLNDYNRRVIALNARNRGASPEEITQLEADRQLLDEEHIAINTKIEIVNNLVTQISNYSTTHNNVIHDTNTIVNKINEKSGVSFEEGVYNQGSHTIIIYEYDSALGLKRVLAHELGHAIGLDHVLGKTSIMYPYNESIRFVLSLEDKAALTTQCEGLDWKTIISKYTSRFTH